jgi:hypothetical protein
MRMFTRYADIIPKKVALFRTIHQYRSWSMVRSLSGNTPLPYHTNIALFCLCILLCIDYNTRYSQIL